MSWYYIITSKWNDESHMYENDIKTVRMTDACLDTMDDDFLLFTSDISPHTLNRYWEIEKINGVQALFTSLHNRLPPEIIELIAMVMLKSSKRCIRHAFDGLTCQQAHQEGIPKKVYEFEGYKEEELLFYFNKNMYGF